MSVMTNAAFGAGGVFCYPLPYPVEEYISGYAPRLDARQLEIMSVGQTMKVKLGAEDQETAYAGGWHR